MLRRRACKWSRQQYHTSALSTRARRCTELSSQLSISRVDAGLVAMHQMVSPCDEMERCSGSVGGGLMRIVPPARSHLRISLLPLVLKRHRGAAGDGSLGQRVKMRLSTFEGMGPGNI